MLSEQLGAIWRESNAATAHNKVRSPTVPHTYPGHMPLMAVMGDKDEVTLIDSEQTQIWTRVVLSSQQLDCRLDLGFCDMSPWSGCMSLVKGQGE